MKFFIGVLAAVSARYNSVEYAFFEDAVCGKAADTITRPIGQCIKEEREGHYRLLDCSAEGVVLDTEFSDSECKVPVLKGEHQTDVCHEGGGLSLKMTCGASTDFTIINATWTEPQKPVVDVEDMYATNATANGACPGVCQANSLHCSSGYKSGLCPGANNIQCCPMPTPSCSGQCQQTSVPCGGKFVAGQCPGASDIQCCTSGGKCVSRNDVISRLVAKANGQYCQCVCPHLSPWRCDCSGIASYAWELPAPGQVTSTLPNYSTRLQSWTDMKPGDIILKPSTHVEVFRKWESGTSVFGYCGCHSTADGCSCRSGSTTSYWQGAGYYPAKGKMVC